MRAGRLCSAGSRHQTAGAHRSPLFLPAAPTPVMDPWRGPAVPWALLIYRVINKDAHRSAYFLIFIYCSPGGLRGSGGEASGLCCLPGPAQ